MSPAPSSTATTAQQQQSRRRRPSPTVKRSIRLGLEILAVAVATASLSALLVRLSGTALRLPPPWGDSLQVMMPLLGVAVFTFFRHGTSLGREWRRNRLKKEYALRKAAATPAEKRKLPGAAQAEKHADMQSRVVTSAIAIVLLVIALLLVLNYNKIRSQTTHRFTVPNYDASTGAPWAWEQWGEGEFPTSREAIALAMEQLEESTPHYVDHQRNVIYLPITLPDDVRRLIELRAGGSLEKGMHDVLTNDPVRLIDWLEMSPNFRDAMQATQWAFFWRHAAILSLVAAAAGAVFAPTQSLARAGAEALAN